MARILKDPDVRRAEILAAAGELFQSQGYKNTTVDAIIRKAGIAKGTFYYYFQSKEDVLAALASGLVDQMVAQAQMIANDPAMDALQKTRLLLKGPNQASLSNNEILEDLHLPENRELHERSNVETVLLFGPIMAGVIEQGNREGVFHVENPLESVQFLLAGSQFLLYSGLFDWKPEEHMAHLKAMQTIIERVLGAETGSFGFLSERDNTPAN